MACLDCQNCLACCVYLFDDDYNKPIDPKEIAFICKAMGGFKRKVVPAEQTKTKGENKSMFNLLKGFIKHEPIDRRHRKDNYTISLCKSGCFGFPKPVIEKYNLSDKKSVALYYNPKEPKKLVVCFQDKLTQGAVKLRFRPNGLGIATALSFLHGNPTYAGKYTVDDAQINAFNGDTFLSIVKQD